MKIFIFIYSIIIVLLFYALYIYNLPTKLSNNLGISYFKKPKKYLFLTRSYCSSSKNTPLDKSIPVVKTLQNEQAQLVLNKMYEHSSGDLKSFLDKNVMHLLDSKYLVESKFLLNDIKELKSVKDSVALGA